jgi:hypothetical protein
MKVSRIRVEIIPDPYHWFELGLSSFKKLRTHPNRATFPTFRPIRQTSVADPDKFDADPDPTSEKPDPDPALCKVL